MSGLQEILVLVLIVIVLFFLPRMVSRPAQQAPTKPTVQIKQIPGKWRLALFVSAVWLVIAALWLKPWGRNLVLFACVGALPVLIFWGAVWVLAGYTRRKP